MADQEILKRLGTTRESAARLGPKRLKRSRFWAFMDSPSRRGFHEHPPQPRCEPRSSEFFVSTKPQRATDRLHRTVELPKPVTQETADQFNQLFGRE